MMVKILSLLILVAACAPQDPKLEDPLLSFKTQEALEDEFQSLFGRTDKEAPLALPLMLVDQNLEAAKIFEFVTNIESELARFQAEADRETRGERANFSILCRDIQKVAESAIQKRFVVTYSCSGRTDSIRNEVRGQEVYILNFTDSQLSSFSMQTYPGFETRILRYLNPGDRNPMGGGVSADVKEDRRLEAMLVEGLSFHYTYSTYFQFKQNFRVHPRNYTDGHTESGELRSNVQGKLTLQLGAGSNPRYFAREMSALPTARGNVGSVTIKSERKSIDRSRLPFSKFYILTGALKVLETNLLNYSNCGEFLGGFDAEARWLTGKPNGNNQYSGKLHMKETEILYSPNVGRNGEEFPEMRWEECYGRSPILPMVVRNKFFLN
jgi:hypothetical protein